MLRSVRGALTQRCATFATRQLASQSKRPSHKKMQASKQQPPKQPAEKTKEELHNEWIHSDDRTVHLTRNEKWVMRIAVVSCTGAIAMFTWTKWEVEKRLAMMPEPEREAWMSGKYVEFKERETQKAMDAAEQMEGFVAAPSFEGERPGFVFKLGGAGLGYYPDVVGKRVAELEEAANM